MVLGATGAVGGALVVELLASPTCSRVVALVRRPVDIFATATGHEKLRLPVVELDDIESATRRHARLAVT